MIYYWKDAPRRKIKFMVLDNQGFYFFDKEEKTPVYKKKEWNHRFRAMCSGYKPTDLTYEEAILIDSL